jgi:hypothetical protein
VLQVGGESNLAQEALWTKRSSEVGVEDLERDRPLVLKVTGEIYNRHPPAPELALEEVAVVKSVPELDGDVGHSGGLKWETIGICVDSLRLASTSAGAERAEPCLSPMHARIALK